MDEGSRNVLLFYLCSYNVKNNCVVIGVDFHCSKNIIHTHYNLGLRIIYEKIVICQILQVDSYGDTQRTNTFPLY